MLFKLKKFVLTDFHFMIFTHHNLLYLQFIWCMFWSDLKETLNIMKSIFDECNKSARKTVKAKINKGFAEDSFKKVSSGTTF